MTSAQDIYPDPLTSAVEVHMQKIANALLEYREVRGELPKGNNAAMVKALQALNPRAFRKSELNARGEVIDPWNRPYVYEAPGQIFQGLFDLYSIGSDGAGKTRPSERIICPLMRL